MNCSDDELGRYTTGILPRQQCQDNYLCPYGGLASMDNNQMTLQLFFIPHPRGIVLLYTIMSCITSMYHGDSACQGRRKIPSNFARSPLPWQLVPIGRPLQALDILVNQYVSPPRGVSQLAL